MRILFVTPRFPYPPLKGDTLRTYHQIRALSHDHQVTLLSMAEAPVGRDDYNHVARLCERVEVVPLPRQQIALNLVRGLFSKRPLQVSYYHSPALQRKLDEMLSTGSFDIVHVTLIRMLPCIWERQDAPVVVDLIDSLGLNLEARRDGARGLKHVAYEIEYQRVLEYERAVVDRFQALVVSSPADKRMLGGKKIEVIPNGVDLDKFPFQGQEGRDTKRLIFTGNMGYGPNEEAVLWFMDEVWPLLRSRHPGLRFQVVGTNPSDRVRDAAARSMGVQVPGRVPDVSACLRRAAVAICPMRSGSGIQNKVLEALSTGTPVVASSIANRGVGGVPGQDLLIADSPAEFASEITRLLNDGGLRASLAEAGRSLVERSFRWEAHARSLVRMYEAQVSTHRPPTPAVSTDATRTVHVPNRINVMQMTDVTGRGGAEKALVDIALRLDPSRYRVSVCATRSAGNYQPILDAAGVTTYIQGRTGRWDLRQWLRLVRLMRRERVDVLHTHLFGSNTLGRLIGKMAGVPVIIAHEHWSTKARREVWVDRLLYRLSDRILVPSQASRRMVMETEGIPGRCIDVLYNGVDTGQFTQGNGRSEARCELGIPSGVTVIGVVGRLSEEKGGVDHLIRVVDRLHATYPDLRLLVVGDGPLRTALEDVAASSGGANVVTFTGTRIDVARLLNAMDIFALPSLNEALPIVVLEAMSVGLPVVATRVGGVPEVVEDGKTGLLVPPGNEQELQAALHLLLSNPALREQLGAAGQAHVTNEFTIERMVERVQAIYESLLDRKRSATRDRQPAPLPITVSSISSKQ